MPKLADTVNSEVYRTAPGLGQAPAAPGTGRVFRVPEGTKPCRVDAFLGAALRMEGVSREKIKQAVAAGAVTRNGRVCAKPTETVFPGDEITAVLPGPVTSLAPEDGDLPVLWRDGHLAVCDKPVGLAVHPSPGREKGTLAHRLVRLFPQLVSQGGLRPGIVHRLDKDTSGLILVALTEPARLAMAKAFAARAVRKEYLALVHGVPSPDTGTVTVPLGRSPRNKTKMDVVPASKGGREARSDYTVLYADPARRFSLVRVAIHTGRTHQIRVHMRHIGHPLLGDAAYALPGLPPLPGPPAPRPMLHAFTLAFTHPVTGEDLAFHLPPPEDFTGLAVRLMTPMQRVVITGSPGGGKSTLTNAVRDAGFPVWSADDAVRALYAKGADGWHLLRARYGARFVPDDSGGVDKQALFAAMAGSDAFRREVERLVHPLVFHSLEDFWQVQERRGAAMAAAEVPLALESGRRAGGNVPGRPLLVGVWTPFALRRQRMMDTRGWSAQTVDLMESWQWPEDVKIRAADLVLDNSGSRRDLQRRAESMITVLACLRQRAALRVRQGLRDLWDSRRPPVVPPGK